MSKRTTAAVHKPRSHGRNKQGQHDPPVAVVLYPGGAVVCRMVYHWCISISIRAHGDEVQSRRKTHTAAPPALHITSDAPAHQVSHDYTWWSLRVATPWKYSKLRRDRRSPLDDLDSSRGKMSVHDLARVTRWWSRTIRMTHHRLPRMDMYSIDTGPA